MKYNYTVIPKTISGKTLSPRHFELKKDAMIEVAYLISHGYQVEVMLFTIFKDREAQK